MGDRVDFYISNNNHHFEMMIAIIKKLKEKGFQSIRLVSLCEFRRMTTPVDKLAELGVDFEVLASLKAKGTSTSTGKKGIGGNQSFLRNILRNFIWMIKLRPALKSIYHQKPSIVIIPNDAAYPFNKICKWFQSINLPYVLIQEGIRFPLPNENGLIKYGTNGCLKVFAWGNTSAGYFEKLGTRQVIPTGNPRIDHLVEADYNSEISVLKARYKLGVKNILYLSNPVDDQGFCTHDQKINYFSMFLKSIINFGEKDLKIILRLHPREDQEVFKKEIAKHSAEDKVLLINDFSIGSVIKASDWSVVLATTAGLESILFGTPVGVIKLGSHGYIFDYVSEGVAVPIDSDNNSSFSNGLSKLLITKTDHSKSENYLNNQFSNLGKSDEVISNEILKLIQGG